MVKWPNRELNISFVDKHVQFDTTRDLFDRFSLGDTCHINYVENVSSSFLTKYEAIYCSIVGDVSTLLAYESYVVDPPR